jgi:hypothetical protein
MKLFKYFTALQEFNSFMYKITYSSCYQALIYFSKLITLFLVAREK